MKKDYQLSACPVCDSKHVEIRHDKRGRYRYLKKDHFLDGQEHTVCADCGASFYLPGQIERNNQRFLEFEKNIVKHIAPREIIALREKYKLSQEQATRIFGCGPTAFSKWERGEVAPTATAAVLLRAALEDPVIMKKFADRAKEKIDLVFAEAETPDLRNEYAERFAYAKAKTKVMAARGKKITGGLSQTRGNRNVVHRNFVLACSTYEPCTTGSINTAVATEDDMFRSWTEFHDSSDDIVLPPPHVIQQILGQ